MRDVASYDIPVKRGDDQSLTLWFRQEDGSAFDLSGSTLTFFANVPKELTDDRSGVLFSPSVNSVSISITDAPGGFSLLAFTLDQSIAVPSGNIARYEIKRTIGGVVETLLGGFLSGTGLGVKQ